MWSSWDKFTILGLGFKRFVVGSINIQRLLIRQYGSDASDKRGDTLGYRDPGYLLR